MITNNDIYVVEPHCDDAFLSLGWSIRKWAREGRRVHIVSVYSADAIRAQESARWAASVGAVWHGVGLYASETITVFDALKSSAEPLPQLPNDLLPESANAPSACRIWPLGLQHPEHLAVAGAAPDGDLRYVDTPYQLSLMHQDDVRHALDGRTFEWWLRPPKKKWDASRYFRSQAELFEQHTPDRLEAAPEIVVR